jgi:transposase-like protein
VKIRGQSVYLYLSVDQEDKTVNFRLSPRRNIAAAKAFLRKTMKSQGTALSSIVLDSYAAPHRAIREMQDEGEIPKEATLRSSKYLNNVVEPDHRNVKSRIGPMLGFKRFGCASITMAGIELMHRIRKGQFLLDELGVQGQGVPAGWKPVLAA